MVIFRTCTAAVCLSNLGKRRMPPLRGIYANFSLGRTVLTQLIPCKSHESFQNHLEPHVTLPLLANSSPFMLFLFVFRISFSSNPGLLCHASPWNHCRSTSSYPNCIFIIRHYSLAYPSIMHYHHFHANLYLCPVGRCLLCSFNNAGFITEFSGPPRERP